MVTIEYGQHRVRVTAGAYEAVYKPNGWNLVDKDDTADAAAAEAPHNEQYSDKKQMYVNMSVDDMTKEQLLEAADLWGVEVNGKNKSAVKYELSEKMNGGE